MSSNKLILTESELLGLIQETTHQIQIVEQQLQNEQWDWIEDNIIDPISDTADDVGDWFGEKFDNINSIYWDYNHGINQATAIVCYAAGALFCYFGKDPRSKALCVGLETLAILIEVIDFQQYMEEDDYYNAGLVAAFVWFPIGRLTVKGLKTLFPKIFQKAINSAIKLGNTPKQTLDYLVRTQGQKFVGKMSTTIKKYPGLLSSIKSAGTKVDDLVKQLTDLSKDVPYWLPGNLSTSLRYIRDYILKPLGKVLKFLTVILASIAAYDPAIIAPLFGWAGRKFDITTFNNIEDWLETLAEDEWAGVSLWNSILDKTGSVEGVITTTRIDCDLMFYQWDDVVEAYKETPYHTNVIRSHGTKKDGINLTGLGEAWREGWRPDINMNALDITAKDLSYKMKKKIKDTFKLTLWSDMKKLLPNKKWFLTNGIEVELWDKFENALKTCEGWLKFIRKEESKQIVAIIASMSDSPNFPEDK